MRATCAPLAQEDVQGLWAWWPKAGLGMHVLLISKMCVVLVDASGQVTFRPRAQGHTGAKMVHSLARLKVLGAGSACYRVNGRPLLGCWGLPWVGWASGSAATFSLETSPLSWCLAAMALPSSA